MAQAHELPVEDLVFPQTADAHSEAVLEIPVQTGLGTGRILKVLKEGLGSVRQLQPLGFCLKVRPPLQDLFFGNLLAEADGNSSHMTVAAGNAQALGADHRLRRVHDHRAVALVFHSTPQLQGLVFALLVFPADIGDDVIHHLRPALEGLAGTADRLVGAYADLGGLKVQQGGQGRHIALDGAVGFDGNEAVLASQALPLGFDHSQVIRVDLRHYHGNVFNAAAGTVIADDRNFMLCVVFFQGADFVLFHVHSTEAEINQFADGVNICCVHNGHIRGIIRDRPVKSPAFSHRFFVFLTGAAGRSRQAGYLEPGMVLQQGNETLSHHSGGTDNTDAILSH